MCGRLRKDHLMKKPCVNQKAPILHPFWRIRAFTLVELLAVVVIIAILAGLLAAWAAAARASWMKHKTEASMNTLLNVADSLKTVSVIFPDHRLANFFFVQRHTATSGAQPIWNGLGGARTMSSGELIAFLAFQVPSTSKDMNSLGEMLPGSPVDPNWGVSQSEMASGTLVDVFQSYPGIQDAVGKANALRQGVSPTYSLVSPVTGYALRAPVDAWGNPLIYRLSTYAGDLNQSDLAVGDSARAGTGSTPPTVEYIVQDEQFTLDRYFPGAGRSAPAASNAATEIVRKAVGAYAYPQFVSAGPDGRWGQFTDGAAPDFTRDARAADKTAARDGDARDNIYSQETGR